MCWHSSKCNYPLFALVATEVQVHAPLVSRAIHFSAQIKLWWLHLATKFRAVEKARLNRGEILREEKNKIIYRKNGFKLHLVFERKELSETWSQTSGFNIVSFKKKKKKGVDIAKKFQAGTHPLCMCLKRNHFVVLVGSQWWTLFNSDFISQPFQPP